MPHPSDSTETVKLLRDVADGSEIALQDLLAQHRPYLKRVVQLRIAPVLANRVDPSDVVQEAQVVIYKRIDEFLQRRPTSFRLWIRQHVLQCLIDEHRKHMADKRSVLREREFVDASSIAIARRLMSESPSRRLKQMELREQVFRAVDELCDNDREVLSLRHAERLSNNEVAELLGLDPNTVRQRYGRALKRLHQQLKDKRINLGETFE